MIAVISILLISFLLIASLYAFIFGKVHKKSYFSYEIFYTLLVVYFTVLTSFACLYFVLSFQGVLLLDDGKLHRLPPLETLAHSFYFSGVTLMTVGYGDITPIGWGRLLALIESLIGYILPPAFFLKIWQGKNGERLSR
ncbi:potassium channel LctB [Gracilibacillus ureilyticus]|uniref:Potassium channel LctB n=1 Tax=Gracilibacillus ureilyticus TaxID=531814 RepID=A0A1H9QEN8_9BACI|nr:potassium channel family protein [Gracilibacillus ureilyticus]SER58860.1 potassium channel LctB [Gracilibacillus ureilyticus]